MIFSVFSLCCDWFSSSDVCIGYGLELWYSYLLRWFNLAVTLGWFLAFDGFTLNVWFCI